MSKRKIPASAIDVPGKRFLYNEFATGDVFLHKTCQDRFVLLGHEERVFSVLSLNTGTFLKNHLRFIDNVPSGYSVYRADDLIAHTV